MAEPERTLDVWCFGRLAGRLTDARPLMTFAYDPSWLTDDLPPLSQSLPLDEAFAPDASAAFFGGLLPEAAPRELLARRLGVSEGNDFSLLAAVGGDTAGAISLEPPGGAPRDEGDVQWLDDEQLVEVVTTLPTRPMFVDEDGEYRLSLAGAQDKLPVVVGGDGRICLTTGAAPSTHILKTPITHLDDTVLNEALCPAVGRALGIDTVTATPRRIGDLQFLLVERYDRQSNNGRVTRLHQEDFCQALGIPTNRKYESEGGPSLADCFGLLRRAADVPAREILRLLDDLALSFLVGNNDAHGKNYSLLYLPDRSDGVLAPAYDVLSTVAYNKVHNLSRKMAMKIGGQYKPEYLEPRHLDRLLAEAGLGAAAARRRLRAHATSAGHAVREARAALSADGWDALVLDRIVAIVDLRADQLALLAAPQRARTATPPVAHAKPDAARPLTPLDRAEHVAPGQRWKDRTNRGYAPDVISVDSVDPDGTVHGTIRRPDAELATPASWPRAAFRSFALVEDPHWPTYLVAAAVPIDDPRVHDLNRVAGDIEGARSHRLLSEGLGSGETAWNVIAPTEADALALVVQIVGPDVPVRAALRRRDEL